MGTIQSVADSITTVEYPVVATASEFTETEPVASIYEVYWRDNPGQVMEVPVEDIIVKPEDDVRLETIDSADTSKEFKSFCAAVKNTGYQPVEVRIVGGRLEIVDGRWRYAAVKANGGDVIRVLPSRDSGMSISRVDAIARALTFNIQRQDLSPVEKMKAMLKLQDAALADGQKLTGKAIAAMLGITPGSVSGYLSLQKYDEDAQALIHSGKIGYAAAISLMAQLGDGEKASTQLKALVAEADEGGSGTVRASAAKSAARKSNEAAGKKKTYQRTSAQAISELDGYTNSEPFKTYKKENKKMATEARIGQEIKSYLTGANTLQQMINGIYKAWD
jgi:ParB/RepB/Spo0J family partition protein